MQEQSPLLRIWGWGKDEHGGLICATLSALTGVVLGMLPYFAAAQIIIKMLAGERDLSVYLPWLGLGLAGYAMRTLLYNLALSMSHKATFSILKAIRQKILEKLPRLPLGSMPILCLDARKRSAGSWRRDIPVALRPDSVCKFAVAYN